MVKASVYEQPVPSPPKLPSAQLWILSICRIAEPIALAGVVPYLPEMIESFNVPHAEVGTWVGIASAIFSVAQCFTAIPWGKLSDNYGRKPVILFSMLCCMVSSLLFGFSQTLLWAILARAAAGFSSGTVGILRTVVAEIVPHKSLQPKAFATLPLVWQVGSIVGPALGGALASPAKRFPELLGKNKFFLKFPYALPNLVASIIFLAGLLAGWLFLKESLESKKYDRDRGRDVGGWLLAPWRRSGKGLRPSDDFESVLPNKSTHRVLLAPPTYRDVFNRQANINLVAYFLLAMHAVAHGSLLSVFLHQTQEPDRSHDRLPWKFGGGYGLDSGRIGTMFMLYGFLSTVTQFTLFPWTTSRLGVLFCFRACTIAFPIAYFLTPFTVLLPTPALRQVALAGTLVLKSLADVFAFPCNTILLTNTARDVHILGTLNGISTSVSAIGRALGPFIAGRLFTWGIAHNYNITSWFFMGGLGVAGHVVTWWLAEPRGFGEPGDEHEAKAYELVESGPANAAEAAALAEGALLADDASIIGLLDGEDDDGYVSDDVIEVAPLLSDGARKERGL